MKIAFIGYGNVGAPLADHLQRLGHQVTLAAKNPESDSVQKAQAINPALQVAEPLQAVSEASVIFLATPFQVASEALQQVQAALKGKIVVDCTNPVGAGLTHGLNNTQSGSEYLQAFIPNTALVKAFTIYGFENFQDNHFLNSSSKPAMLYCGNNKAAKETVGQLIEQLGWQALDTGELNQALHLEHMTLLWIKMVRLQGRSPHLVWAALER
ncbi:NADPH-dependent F420 reductase [Thiofilum flexile]|uniref:NADPH-dependent F420 reductase n=1 Tax=Thiofilum flexile TaxID=125627 RepID=UPI000365D063|nr:NADPH-dependent F420 reductase [Thiofilum flexile]